MSDRRQEIRDEVEALVAQGDALHVAAMIKEALHQGQEDVKDIDEKLRDRAQKLDFGKSYQGWYSKALRVVEQLLPDRYDEFRSMYRLDKDPKELDVRTYTISDYIAGIRVTRGLEEVVTPWSVLKTKFENQINIVRSASDRLNSLLADIRGVLEAEVFDDELSAAEGLRKAKHLRSAGVVAGVVLERHLKRVAANHAIKFQKKDPTISYLNDLLKENSVYDVPEWRRIQRLGDLRNLAGHDRERDPTADEIRELIDGVERAVQTVF